MAAGALAQSKRPLKSDVPHLCCCRFAFIFLTLVVVAGWTSTAKCKVASLLNRQQTEEWKGWMQVGSCDLQRSSTGTQGQEPGLPGELAFAMSRHLFKLVINANPGIGIALRGELCSPPAFR